MGSTLVFSEFELDTVRHELRRAGALQIVQPKVLSLLIYLARHQPEETVTRGSVKRAI